MTISQWGIAQREIPLGTWRLHVSYNNVTSVAVSENYVFGGAQNGIVLVDRKDHSIQTLTKLNGLHGGGITVVEYDAATDQLIVAYKDGKIDLVKDNEIVELDPSRNSTLAGSKRINHIDIRNGLAYLSADYGVIIFDLTRRNVKETWRDIGESGQRVKVLQSTFKDDSIFLATDRGVLAGNLNTNLLDFNFWKRYDDGNFSTEIQSIAVFNEKVYAAIATVGIFSYESGVWTQESFLANNSFYNLNASSSHLFVSSSTSVWKLSLNNAPEQVTDTEITQSNMAIEDENGKLWIADQQNGIVSNSTGGFVKYLPNGPSNEKPVKLNFNNEVMYTLGGGRSEADLPLKRTGWIDQFAGGTWSTQTSTLQDLTDIAFLNNQRFVSSFGQGIEIRNEQTSLQILDDSNSPLINTNSPGRSVNITAVEQTDGGIWVANYGSPKPLHFFSNENTWQSYSFSNISLRYPTGILIDNNNNVWSILNPTQGGGILVFDKEKNVSNTLTTISGSGSLPSNSVYSMALDRDGVVWVGTSEGVSYFADPALVFSNGVNGVRPIFEGRFILRDDRVSAIAVDGGNRKWMGTDRGVWLFSPAGESQLYNFTMENTPLLSNQIIDIEIDHTTGEVFFATEQGLVSYRADATQSGFQFETLKIFPNPVTPDFHGTVAISGLATDAVVKITDISGKLVWEGEAHGGTASWNIRNFSGKRAATGVYLIFCASADGVESAVGKVAVVE